MKVLRLSSAEVLLEFASGARCHFHTAKSSTLELSITDAGPGSTRGPEDKYVLWRQDDNGNSFLVATFQSEQEAEARRRVYEDRGHKQLYWVAPGDGTA